MKSIAYSRWLWEKQLEKEKEQKPIFVGKEKQILDSVVEE